MTVLDNGARVNRAPEELSEFYRGYLACAKWSTGATHPFSGELLEHLEVFEPSREFKLKAIADCQTFWRTHFDRLQTLCIEHDTDWAQHGHDLWLTRNGHGTGYWDRSYGEAGDRLTEAAQELGEVSLYLGDDLLIYGG